MAIGLISEIASGVVLGFEKADDRSMIKPVNRIVLSFAGIWDLRASPPFNLRCFGIVNNLIID